MEVVCAFQNVPILMSYNNIVYINVSLVIVVIECARDVMIKLQRAHTHAHAPQHHQNLPKSRPVDNYENRVKKERRTYVQHLYFCRCTYNGAL